MKSGYNNDGNDSDDGNDDSKFFIMLGCKHFTYINSFNPYSNPMN